MITAGKFISLEGIEGVGKSTAMDFVTEQLEAAGIEYVRSREPGGTPLSEDIRSIVLKHYQAPMVPATELLLFFAGRAQNVQEVILPALQAGKWVVCDRFVDASFAYQGAGRGIAQEHVAQLAQWSIDGLLPSLTLLLDAPVKIGLQRMSERGEKDRIEQETIDFFTRARNCYLDRAKQDPSRITIIDATQSIQAVRESLAAALQPLLNEYQS